MSNWVLFTFCFPVLVPPFEKSNCKSELLFEKLVIRHRLLRHTFRYSLLLTGCTAALCAWPSASPVEASTKPHAVVLIPRLAICM